MEPTKLIAIGISGVILNTDGIASALEPERNLTREMILRAPPFDGALDATRWLFEQRYARTYITSLPAALERTVRDWLELYAFPPLPITFAEHGAKAVACWKLHATCLIEHDRDEVRIGINSGLGVFHVRPQEVIPGAIGVGNLRTVTGLLKRLPLDYRSTLNGYDRTREVWIKPEKRF